MDRKRYIGGTDCAPILGLSRWKSTLAVWAEKTGLVPAPDISDRIHVRLGIALEDTVAKLFEEETGKRVGRVNETIYHKEHDFIGANIDRRVIGEDAILEAKTCSAWKAKEWAGEDMPQEYVLQCLHYLAVTGKSLCYLAVLIGNHDFKFKIITRDEPTIKTIIQKEVEFWNTYVVPKVMPMTIAVNDGSTLYQLFPISDPNESVVLPDDVNIKLEQLEAHETEKWALEQEIEKLKNELKAMLKDNEKGQTSLYRLSWKTQNMNRMDTERFKKENEELYKAYLKTTSTRVFRYARLEKGDAT